MSVRLSGVKSAMGRVILETSRLRLREMSLADLDFIARLLGDDQVMRYYPAPYTREQSKQWIWRQQTRYGQDGCGLWLAEDRSSGEPRGQVGLCKRELTGEVDFEIGYLIYKDYWGQGLAPEAALAVRDHAWWERDLSRVISLIRPVNGPSIRVAEKLGFAPGRRVIYSDYEHIVYVGSRPQRSRELGADSV